MALSSTSVHTVEQAPIMAAASISNPTGSPSCLLPLQEAFQDEQGDLIQAPLKLLPLC